MRIKKGDQVVVISGKDRGKRGRVMKVYPKSNEVLIEKINYRTVYLRRSQQNPQGGIAKVEGKINSSNVMLIDPRSAKPTRVGRSILADGTRHRIAKKSGEIIGE
ncbi:MAG: 50S ribosomal protein L24 [Candidatus Omnitrophica bacterium]|nr:50S ribosomal protein L24 [Candidatus Omnitrophota bacterium]